MKLLALNLVAALAFCSTALAQTYRAVTADTNNVIRTNFTLPFGQLSFGGGATNAVPVTSGGTGATNTADALVNLLPSYTGNSNAVLALNSNATAIVWSTNAGGLPETPLSVTNGGTGGTNQLSALQGLGVISSNNGITIGVNTTNGASSAAGLQIVIGNGAASLATNETSSVAIGAETVVTNMGVAIGWRAKAGGGISIGSETETLGNGVAIGRSATAFNGTVTNQAATNDKLHGGIAIGPWADGGYGGSGGGVAIGFLTWADNYGVALGWRATSTNGGFAVGYRARSHAGIQLLTGTNNNTNTVQLLSAGSVDTNEWAALANAGTVGTNLLRAANITNAQAAIFTATTTNAPTNTNAPTPDAWLDIRVGTNDYKLPLWQ